MKYRDGFLIKSLYLFLQDIANKCPWINTFKGLSRKSRPMQSLITTPNKYIFEIPLFCFTNNHNVLSCFVMFHSRSKFNGTNGCRNMYPFHTDGLSWMHNKNSYFFTSMVIWRHLVEGKAMLFAPKGGAV